MSEPEFNRLKDLLERIRNMQLGFRLPNSKYPFRLLPSKPSFRNWLSAFRIQKPHSAIGIPPFAIKTLIPQLAFRLSYSKASFRKWHSAFRNQKPHSAIGIPHSAFKSLPQSIHSPKQPAPPDLVQKVGIAIPTHPYK